MRFGKKELESNVRPGEKESELNARLGKNDFERIFFIALTIHKSHNNVCDCGMPHMPLHAAGEFAKRMRRLAVQAYSADDSPVAP